MQTLEDSELRYRRLFEAAQDGILILDAETGMIKDVNPYLIKMLGYSREEFIKKKLWEVGAFRDIEASKDAFEALQNNEYIRYEDLPLKTKDGRLIQVEFVSNVYLVGDEKVIQCDIRDITEHKRIINALHGNEKQYHDLINQSPDGYFVIELSGKILTVNKAMCKELEFSEEEFLSMNIWDIIPQQFLGQYKERLTKILKGESLRDAAEYEVRGKNGKNHYVEVLSAPRYSGKDIIGFQGIARDITARKRAEGALKESEERLHAVLNSAPITIFATDKKGVFTLHEGRGLQQVGMKPGENVGMSAFELYRSLPVIEPSGKVTTGEDIIHRVLGGEIVTGITELKDVSFDNQFAPLLDAEGQVVGLVGVSTDITERKQAEKFLREREEQYRTLVEQLPAIVFIDDANDEGRTMYISPQIETILGFTQQQWKEESPNLWDKQVHPDDLERVHAAYMRCFQYGEPYTAEYRISASDGRVLWIRDQAIMLRDENGKPNLIHGMMYDITERKRAEEALRESEERFRMLVEQASDGIFISNDENRFIEVNSAGCRMLGYTRDELLQKTIPDLTKIASTQPLQLDELRLGKAILREREMIRKDGSLMSVEINAKQLPDGRVQGIVRDITGRKQAELRIRRQVDYLTALQDIDRTIATAIDMSLSLNALISKAITLLAVDAAAVLLIDFTMNTLEFAAGDGFRTNSARTPHIKLCESYAGRAAMEHRIVKIPDLKNETDNLFLTGLHKGEDFVSYYGLPLIVKGKVIGVLEVFQRSLIKRDQEWFDFLNALAGQAAIAISNAQLFDNLQHSNTELIQAYDATIEGWSRALDLRDKETEGHSKRVTEMTVKLARTFGLSEAELVQVRWGSLLHDIGKMGVPDGILLKPGPLTDEEWVAMRKHPVFAYEMLAPIRYLRLALDIPYCHHEKWDGTGYPRGLKGDQIPLTARIFAIVDVSDALHSDRPYRKAWEDEKVREHIQSLSGTHFDPQVVEVFMQILD